MLSSAAAGARTTPAAAMRLAGAPQSTRRVVSGSIALPAALLCHITPEVLFVIVVTLGVIDI
jgi:hypothetical protein